MLTSTDARRHEEVVMTQGHDQILITVRQPGHQSLTLLLDEELVIGRDCEGLLLADPEVSRRHLLLRRRGATVEVSDLGSTNGIFRDNRRLAGADLADGPTRYQVGDTELSIGFGASGAGRAGAGRLTDLREDRDLRSTSIDRVADALASAGREEGSTGYSGSDTLTMVFSDIESSTERAETMGDRAWFELLERHNELLRRHCQVWGGTEVKSIGDGFFLAFRSVGRALAFAVGVQRDLDRDPALDLRIRMGIHTGEAIADSGGDLFGRHVNLAARIANLATGAQILASLVVREIATGQSGFHFSDSMTAELKGFDEPHIVHEVRWADDD